MSEETKPTGIYTALALAAADIAKAGIAKDRTADTGRGGRYQFRGIDDVYNALAPILSKRGVVIVPEYTEHSVGEFKTGNDRVMFRALVRGVFRAYGPDGSFVTGATYGEGMDSGDKATNKAMSAAYKYFSFQLLCIPVEGEAIDSETASPEVQGRAARSGPLGSQVDTILGLAGRLFPAVSMRQDLIAVCRRLDLPPTSRDMSESQASALIRELERMTDAADGRAPDDALPEWAGGAG